MADEKISNEELEDVAGGAIDPIEGKRRRRMPPEAEPPELSRSDLDDVAGGARRRRMPPEEEDRPRMPPETEEPPRMPPVSE